MSLCGRFSCNFGLKHYTNVLPKDMQKLLLSTQQKRKYHQMNGTTSKICDLVLLTLSKHMPSSWMPNVILVDNVQAEINVLKFDFPKSTYYNSMIIYCVL
jgi:hypothetical protein